MLAPHVRFVCDIRHVLMVGTTVLCPDYGEQTSQLKQTNDLVLHISLQRPSKMSIKLPYHRLFSPPFQLAKSRVAY